MRRIPLEKFESFVRDGVEAIPSKFCARIKNAAFLVRERPTAAQRRQNGLRPGETLLGLYEGIPHPARGEGYGGLVLPDRITIFKGPIEAEAHSLVEEYFGNGRRPRTSATLSEMFKEEVRRLVIDTVWHEVAHHFGLDEAGVARRERERQGLKGQNPNI